MAYTPMQLAEAYIQTGELQDAVAALKEHLNVQPLDDSARRLLASVLMRLPEKENIEEAVRHLEVLRTAEDYVMMGLIKERSGDEYEPVVDEFYYAWRLDRNNERLGEMYIERLIQTDTREQLGEALSVILYMPRTWRWLKWAGDVSVQMSAYSWAVMYYNEALADLERQFDTLNNAFSANLKANLVLKRANTYLNLKDLDTAESDYKLAETIVPGDVTITFQRGLLAFLRGDMDEAVRLCQTGLKAANETLSWHMRATLIQEQYAPLSALLDAPTP